MVTEGLTINECLKDEVIELLDDDDNWNKNSSSNCCKVCRGMFDEDFHFHLYKYLSSDVWCMDFHYGCALKDEYAEEFEAELIDGEVV